MNDAPGNAALDEREQIREELLRRQMTPEAWAERAAIKAELARRAECERLEKSFEAFVRAAWPVLEPSTTLEWSWHMTTICGYLQAAYERRLRSPYLLITVPPGSSKSLLTSVMWPAWIWARDPGERFLAASNEDSLVIRDNLKHRAIVESDWYRSLWGLAVVPDPRQWEKTFFQTSRKGYRLGVTVNGAVTGKRGGILIVDDPHDAKRAFSDVEIQSTLRAWDQSLSTRVNSLRDSLRIIIMQRLRTNDLAGHVLAKKKQAWVHLSIAMEYEGEPGYNPVADIGPEAAHLADPRRKLGELMDPQRFPRAAVNALKEDLGEYGTAGQLQQRPAPLSGGILKSQWWRVWGKDGKTANMAFPRMLHCFASWDTALSEKDLKANAYSAKTRWGVFYHEDLQRHCLMLLGRWYERCAYPELIEAAKAESKDKLTHPGDAHLIEAKASGISMRQTLGRIPGIYVRTYDPKPDGDKVSRAYLAQRLLKAGLIWVPSREEGNERVPLRWAQDLIDRVATFPAGEPPSADLADTVTQAILYLERKHWVHHPDDDLEPDDRRDRLRAHEDDYLEDRLAAQSRTADNTEWRYGYG
jgi:phage terminase large subunit-like protein